MTDQNKDKFAWIKQHADTVVVLTAILGTFFWINIKFEDTNRRFDERFAKLEERLTVLERDVAVIKAVLCMKNIMPPDLAKKEKE